HVVDESATLSLAEAGAAIDVIFEELKQNGKKVLAAASKMVAKTGVKFDTALVESVGMRVADQITAEAKRWRADLIVIGTHGRRGMQRLLMGSDAEMVVRNTEVPVLLTHGPREKTGVPASR
ncbi:MAG: universal stress protein, partial [Burkholderiales bacterium]